MSKEMPNESKGMTYKETGVNYEQMDPFKIAAQKAAISTAGNIERFNFSELKESRGESAYVIEMHSFYMAFVEEGLGTKNLVADAMREFTNKTYYDHIAQCGMAMIINDLITVGALPVTALMHLAVGNSDWFDDEKRCKDLIKGWKKACDLAKCSWGGGETPTLKGIVIPGASVLSGSAAGIITSEEKLLFGSKIKRGDAIVLVESSGIHANGLTLAREIAGKLPRGYMTHLSLSNCSYGEALLKPTLIYAPIIEACQLNGVELHYAVNITGHGWRKLMRAPQKFCYVIEKIPDVPEVLQKIQRVGKITDEEAYGNLNMGAGFGIYAGRKDAERVVKLAKSYGFNAFVAGYVDEGWHGRKSVRINPINLIYDEESLKLR